MITPYFSLNKTVLDDQLSLLLDSLASFFPSSIIGYSFKTNSLPWLVNYLKDKNIYAEVVSYHEYALAKAIGYQHIIYNGPMKDKGTFFEALSDNQIVNIETCRELDWLKEFGNKAKIGLRINFDLESYCPGESACGMEGGRFGFCYENGVLKEVIDQLSQMENIKIAGIHLHVSSKSRSLNIYKAIAKVAYEVIETYQLDVDYIDIGGGFFGGLANKPQFKDYFKVIKDELKKYSTKTIIVEPGTAVIAPVFSYTASVIDVKDTSYNRFAVIDGSRNDLDPKFHKSQYFYQLQTSSKLSVSKQVVSGYSCMEDDRIMTLIDQPELTVGDRVTFDKVGSYTMALAPNFIKYSPRVYLIDGDEEPVEIKNEWTVQEYIAGSKLTLMEVKE